MVSKCENLALDGSIAMASLLTACESREEVCKTRHKIYNAKTPVTLTL